MNSRDKQIISAENGALCFTIKVLIDYLVEKKAINKDELNSRLTYFYDSNLQGENTQLMRELFGVFAEILMDKDIIPGEKITKLYIIPPKEK